MAKRRRLLEAASLVCALCLPASPTEAGPTVATATRAPLPYLRALGPAPLRFQSPRPVAQPALLASLRQRDSLPAASNRVATGSTNAPAEQASSTNTIVPTIVASAPAHGPSLPERPAEFALPFPIDPGTAQAPVLDPQLVLQYLTPSATNTSHAKLDWPAFIPPMAPPPQRSSQATYERR